MFSDNTGSSCIELAAYSVVWAVSGALSGSVHTHQLVLFVITMDSILSQDECDKIYLQCVLQ